MVVGESKLLLIKNQRPHSVLKVGRRWANEPSDKGALLFFFVKFYVQAGACVDCWCNKIEVDSVLKAGRR